VFEHLLIVKNIVKITLKMDKIKQSWKEMGVTDPKERLRSLGEYASKVEIDPNIPARR
jgi:hypothetical protein